MGFRNLMEEVGLMNDEPTTIYQDKAVTRLAAPIQIDSEPEGVACEQE
jgi:hypothetical protein